MFATSIYRKSFSVMAITVMLSSMTQTWAAPKGAYGEQMAKEQAERDAKKKSEAAAKKQANADERVVNDKYRYDGDKRRRRPTVSSNTASTPVTTPVSADASSGDSTAYWAILNSSQLAEIANGKTVIASNGSSMGASRIEVGQQRLIDDAKFMRHEVKFQDGRVLINGQAVEEIRVSPNAGYKVVASASSLGSRTIIVTLSDGTRINIRVPYGDDARDAIEAELRARGYEIEDGRIKRGDADLGDFEDVFFGGGSSRDSTGRGNGWTGRMIDRDPGFEGRMTGGGDDEDYFIWLNGRDDSPDARNAYLEFIGQNPRSGGSQGRGGRTGGGSRGGRVVLEGGGSDSDGQDGRSGGRGFSYRTSGPSGFDSGYLDIREILGGTRLQTLDGNGKFAYYTIMIDDKGRKVAVDDAGKALFIFDDASGTWSPIGGGQTIVRGPAGGSTQPGDGSGQGNDGSSGGIAPAPGSAKNKFWIEWATADDLARFNRSPAEFKYVGLAVESTNSGAMYVQRFSNGPVPMTDPIEKLQKAVSDLYEMANKK